MNAIRAFFGFLTTLIATAIGGVWTFIMAIGALVAFLVNEDLGHFFHRLWARGICLLFGIRIRFYFTHAIPATGGSVLAANHQSMFDIPILACLPVDFKWISKQEVRNIPFLGWAMEKMGCFFISRRNSNQDLNVLRGAEEGLKRGKRIVIFPEGTRSRDGRLLPVKKGAFRLAQNAGVPLIPIAIRGSFSIAPAKSLPTRWGHDVTVRVGPALVSRPGEDLSLFADKYSKELVRLLEEGDAS